MNRITMAALALVGLGFAACSELDPVSPPVQEQPAATSMTFKSGARYEFASYHTDPSDNTQKVDTSERRRTWTLVNTNATVQGQTGVAVYVDSVFSLGGVFGVADTTYLQQRTNNDVYRFGSLAPELDVSGLPLIDIGREWMYEAKLNATSARWFVAEIADTFPFDQIPLVTAIKVGIKDSATASEIVDLPINGTSYKATKTTHTLRLSFTALTSFGLPVDLKSETLLRTTWTVPSLGVIAREERQGKVVGVSYGGQSYTFPIPGYVSVMTKVLATGG